MFTQARESTTNGPWSFRFDGVVFHPASGRLDLDGSVVALRPRTAAVLEYLLLHRDRLISKDELLGQVWSGSVVTDDSLTQCIKEIRRALTPAHGHVVRTVPRVGYQMAVPVVMASEQDDAVVSPPVARPSSPNGSWLGLMGALVTLALLAGLAGMALHRHGIASARPPLSILVLPFTDADGTPGGSWLGDTLAGELTLRLGQTEGAQVISADTARAFRHAGQDPRRAANALGVRYVVSGTVRHDGHQVRLTLVLTDGVSGMQRWAQQMAVDREQVHLSIDDLARQVARSLNLQMHRWSGEAAAALHPSQVTADDLAMQGWAVYFRGLTPDNLQAAGVLFEKAVDHDPRSVRGWGGVAAANGMAAYTHWARDRPAAVRRLHQALAQLHELEADGLYAHVGRSLAALIQADWEAVLVINNAAIERFPGHSPSHYARALALTRLGRFDECLEATSQALKIGPRDHQAGAYHLQAGFCHFHRGEFALAAHSARKAQEFSPRLDLPALLLAAAMHMNGEGAGARDAMAAFRLRRPAFGQDQVLRLLSGDNERYRPARTQFVQALAQLGLP